MVACTPLYREAAANRLFQSPLDRDILYGGVETEEEKRGKKKKKEKEGLTLTSAWWG